MTPKAAPMGASTIGNSSLMAADEVAALLDSLPPGGASCANAEALDPEVADPPMSAHDSSSGSGTSSPTPNAAPAELRPVAPAAGNFDFAVEELDMWDMLFALDGKTAGSNPGAPCASPAAWGAGGPAFPGQATTPLKGAAAKVAARAAGRPGKAASPRPAATKVVRSAHPKHIGGKPAPDSPAMLRKSQLAMPAMPSSSRGRGSSDDGGADDAEAEYGGGGGFGAEYGAGLSLDDLDENPNDTAEEKRLKRMRRNRESAAMSRNRKKQYVEELEAQLHQLNDTVHALQDENVQLRRECQRLHIGADGAPARPPARGGGAHVPLAQPLGADDLAGELALDMGDLDDSPAPAAGDARGAKRSGSPLGAPGAGKRVSAASLALMSAVTFVTFSYGRGGGAWAEPRLYAADAPHHAPGARVLMSIEESVAHLLGRASPAAARAGGAAGWATGLEPYETLAHGERGSMADLEHTALTASSDALEISRDLEMLPLPDDALHAVSGGGAPPMAPRAFVERVIRLPVNSSWADVLRIEESERLLAEAQLNLARLGASGAGHALAAPPTPGPAAAPSSKPYAGAKAVHEGMRRVYEPEWKDDDEADGADGGAGAHAAAAAYVEGERFIFCARTYMFDAAAPRPVGGARPGSAVDLPAGMPARFRHGVLGGVPQLTSGNTSADEADAVGHTMTLLLPSAALRGIHPAFDIAPELGRGGRGGADLLQVQVRVLNASRWS